MTASRSLCIFPAASIYLLLAIPVANAQYSGGTGEPNDPYQIATAADLIALGETPDDYDKHSILTADIDLDPNLPGGKVFDKAVIAADTEAHPYFSGTTFSGALDGNGHTISHLTIRGNGKYLGLFGKLGSGSMVSNLILQAIAIKEDEHSKYCGGLAGLSEGDIIASSSSGEVSGVSEVGGLVGYNKGGITMSYSTGEVSGRGSVGGLVLCPSDNV